VTDKCPAGDFLDCDPPYAHGTTRLRPRFHRQVRSPRVLLSVKSVRVVAGGALIQVPVPAKMLDNGGG